MKLLLIILFRLNGEKPIKLAQASDLTAFNYFTRGSIAEHLHFGTRTVIQRTPAGSRQTVELKKDLGFVCHAYNRQDTLSGCVVADEEYPQRVAFTVLNRVMEQFEKLSEGKWKNIDVDQPLEPEFMIETMKEWQNPNSADKLTKIQKNLDEIKDVMHKNIEEVLKRGETLDTLMDKSDDLSSSSKIFYKKAKDQNRCCKAF